MRDSINPRKRRGYLLFEVVLALILAGLLIGGVMSIATGALQVSEIIANDGRQQLTREAFLGFVGRNLEQLPGNAVVDLQREDAGSHYTSKLTFQNVPTSFSWSGQAISAEAIQLSAELTRSGDLNLVLKYYEEPILDDSDSTAQVNADPVAQIILLRNVWRFEWWALDGRTMEWTETWDVRGRMPLQLELNVIFDRNGEEIIHYFWIPPKVNPETIMRSLQPGRGSGRGAQPQPGGERIPKFVREPTAREAPEATGPALAVAGPLEIVPGATPMATAEEEIVAEARLEEEPRGRGHLFREADK